MTAPVPAGPADAGRIARLIAAEDALAALLATDVDLPVEESILLVRALHVLEDLRRVTR